jgi:PAS domain S-box-containing protein
MPDAENPTAPTSATKGINRPALLAIGVAILAVAAATPLTLLLSPYSSSAPFGVYCLAVMVAAGFGGAWAGGVATALSAVALDYLLLLPPHTAAALPHRFVSFAIFLCVAGTVVFLIHRIRLHARRVRGNQQHLSRVLNDISERKAIESQLHRLNRLYAASSQINQAIALAETPRDLLHKVCKALVDHGGFQMAWIGSGDPETKLLVPIAESGDENGYLRSIRIYTDDRPEGRGPSGIAFREARPHICEDSLNDPAMLPWRAETQRRGFRACAAFPIRLKGEVCGTLTVHASHPGFFQEKETALLAEAAGNISFALDNFARNEELRAAETIAQREMRFSDAMIESMPGIVYLYDDRGRFLRWNRNFEVVSGYSRQEITAMHPLDFFAGDDKQLLEKRISEVFDRGGSSAEAAFLSKDGSATPYYFTGRRVTFEEMPCLVGVGIDLSERKRAELALRDLNESLEKKGV